MKAKTINEKLNETKQELNLNKLENDVLKFRIEQEDYYDWCDDKSCFRGTCQDITNDFVEYLISIGYNAIRTRGYYKNANDDYYPNMIEWDYRDQERFNKAYYKNYNTCNGMSLPHWWVEINNKIIVDITECQFHPGEEDEYRIGIYHKPNEYYKKG